MPEKPTRLGWQFQRFQEGQELIVNNQQLKKNTWVRMVTVKSVNRGLKKCL